MRLDLGAISRAQILTCLICFALGMLHGRGGAVREFPPRFFPFRLIWAHFPLCGWIWARSAGQSADVFSLGMSDGRGGAGRESPPRLVWFGHALPSAVGFRRAQRCQNADVFPLGMLNGRGGAVREFPSRFVSFDLGTLFPLRLDLGALSGARLLTWRALASRTVAGEQYVSSHPVWFGLVSFGHALPSAV